MKMGQQGLDLLKKWEGFSATAYPDVAGHMTIGYGHLIKQGESFTSITREMGEALLREDLEPAEKAVNSYVVPEIKQCQFDALVMFTYNLGTGAFKKSTLLKRVNDHEWLKVPTEFIRWINAGGRPYKGLLRRRLEEARLFMDY